MNPHELDLVLTFIQSHPDAAARELELLPLDIAVELVGTLPLNQGRQIILQLLPTYAARVCAELSVDMAAGLLADSHSNRVTAILRCMSKSRRAALLKGLPEKIATICRLLLSYSEDTVGAWMTADIVMLPANCVAAGALQRLTLIEVSADSNEIPVVGEGQQLVGFVDVRDLLRAKGDTIITGLIKKADVAVSSRASLATTAGHDGWHNHDTLAVLNRNKQLVGMLRHVDLRRSLERFSEDSFVSQQEDLLGGMSEAYVGVMGALLGLVSGGAQSSRILEAQR